jgi:hypothetical protein
MDIFSNFLQMQHAITQATIWRSRLAPGKEFKTEADADAFEHGWSAFHAGEEVSADAAWRVGWLAAEAKDRAQREQIDQERAEERKRIERFGEF